MPTLIHYRDKCIGCNVCFEMWPVRWRMSTTDGKATLVGGIKKKNLHILRVSPGEDEINVRVANACPVKVIKVQP